jgi:hypothetical protein
MCRNYRKHLGREIPNSGINADMIIRTFGNGTRFVYFDRAGKEMMPDEVRAAIWHEAMARTCRESACYPWFPVMSDPPES